MFLKSLTVLLALFYYSVNGYVLHSTRNDMLKELVHTLKTFSQDGILDLNGAIQELTTAKQLAKIPQHIPDVPFDILPEEALCLLEVIENSDAETQALAEEFIKESINWLQLQQQRDQELQVCEALLGDNPNTWTVAQYQSCRLQVQATTGVAVTVSATRARLLFWELRGIHFEGLLCFIGVV